MRDQSPVLRLDLHERLPLDPLKGRVKEILELELVPEVDVHISEMQVSLTGHLCIKGSCLAETVPLSEYEWEQEPSSEEVRGERTSEPFPFEYRIPLDIVLPRHRVSDPEQLRVSISQMDFDLSSPHELEVLAELVVEGVRHGGRLGEQTQEEEEEPAEVFLEPHGVGQDVTSAWTIQLVSGRDMEENDQREQSDSSIGRPSSETEPLIGDARSEETGDEIEVVARAEPEPPLSQNDGNENGMTPEEDPVPSMAAEHDLKSTAVTGETSEVETISGSDQEGPGMADESMRVTVGPYTKEDPGDGMTTWSQWFSAAQKTPTVPQAAEESGNAADVVPTDVASGGEVTAEDAPDEPSSEIPVSVEEGVTETSAVPDGSVKTTDALEETAESGSDEESAESRATSSLSDYLAPILKGKAERFVSLRLYRVSETEHVEDVARQFDVSVTELMRLNRIAEPTFLEAGNVLFIPVKKE